MNKKLRLIIGVDEAGRGPLAGPITLSVFVAPKNLKRKLIKILGGKIKDSKQFSDKRRKEIYKEFKKLRKESKMSFAVSHVSNKIIDNRGISKAIKLGIKRSLNSLIAHCPFFRGREFLVNRKNFKILLDGSLKAPEEYKNQKTIIKGDEKDVFIACASIVAKVRHDRLMCRLGSKYPSYAFPIHKGYGTKLHYSLLQKHGLSPIHRKSFLKNLT